MTVGARVSVPLDNHPGNAARPTTPTVRPHVLQSANADAAPSRSDRRTVQVTGTSAQRQILQVQRTVGNQAVAALLRPVQREIGWSDAKDKRAATGGVRWNAAPVEDVAGTHMRRIPISGLSEGHQGETLGSESAQLTDESAMGRAVVIVSGRLNPDEKVDVLLHLHGYAENAKSRPFAGWRQRKTDGAVRDVALDQIEQQLDGLGRPQLVGILAQGGERSEFGKSSSYELAMEPYINDVFDKMSEDPALRKRLQVGRIILAAHSGGSHTVVDAMKRDLAGKQGTPGQLGEVILFDAVNVGDKERKALPDTWAAEAREPKMVARWLKMRLDADRLALSAMDTADQRKAYLAGSFVFRGYYTGGYGKVYRALQKKLDAWFADPRLARAAGGELESLRSHYTTVKTSGLAHEDLMRGHKAGDAGDPAKGNVRDAIGAMYDPVGNDPKEMTAPAFSSAPGPTKGGRKSKIKRKTRATSKAATSAAGPSSTAAVGGPGRTPSAATSPSTAAARGKAKKKAHKEADHRTAVELIAAAVGRASSSRMRRAIEADLRGKRAGMTAAAWFQGLRPDATFLGLPIRASGGDIPGVHEELLSVLKTAEQSMQRRLPGKSLAEIAALLEVYDVAGLRPPKAATGGTRVTMHAYGLAIDVNYKGNPFLGQDNKAHDNVWGNRDAEMIKRATQLMTGHSTSIRENPHRLTTAGKADTEEGRDLRAERAGELWEKHATTSDALRDYLNLTDDAVEDLVRLHGQGHDVAWWKAQHAADRDLSRESGELSGHSDPAGKHGVMDLTKELVLLLVRAGLSWGGAYNSGKDLMHFDLRTGSIVREIL
jgi:hypothetical protein